MSPSPSFFDPHLHADGLSDQDLSSLAFFGMKGAVLPAHDGGAASAKELLAHFEALLGPESERLTRRGIRPFVALGVHPCRIPWHGLEEVLAAIPRMASGGRLVALGEIGLEKGDAREEQVLERQLTLALELRLPVLVHTPDKAKERITRRVLAIVRASGLSPSMVLVDHANRATLKGIRECGFHAGLTVNPTRMPAEEVVSLISEFGCEGMVVSSDAGEGSYDLLAMARTASLLAGERLSPGIVKRALGENALAFLGIARTALREVPARAKKLPA